MGSGSQRRRPRSTSKSLFKSCCGGRRPHSLLMSLATELGEHSDAERGGNRESSAQSFWSLLHKARTGFRPRTAVALRRTPAMVRLGQAPAVVPHVLCSTTRTTEKTLSKTNHPGPPPPHSRAVIHKVAEGGNGSLGSKGCSAMELRGQTRGSGGAAPPCGSADGECKRHQLEYAGPHACTELRTHLQNPPGGDTTSCWVRASHHPSTNSTTRALTQLEPRRSRRKRLVLG